MDPHPIILISFFLWLAAVVLMVSHVRTWRRLQRQQFLDEDRDFFRRQYRRRMQTSAMLGLLAAAVLFGQLVISPLELKALSLVYWIVVLAVAVWMGLLAAADLLATKHRFDRMRQAVLAEQAKLHNKIHHMRSVRGNGQAHAKDREPDDEPC